MLCSVHGQHLRCGQGRGLAAAAPPTAPGGAGRQKGGSQEDLGEVVSCSICGDNPLHVGCRDAFFDAAPQSSGGGGGGGGEKLKMPMMHWCKLAAAAETAGAQGKAAAAAASASRSRRG